MRERADRRRHWGRIALLIAITACAAFLRLYRIGSLPPADGYDAAYYGVDALQLLRGEAPRVMYPPNREPLFSYMVAAAFALLGPSTLAIHATSAFVGILTVPAVYWTADALFSEAEEPLRRWAGPLAALMTALSYWHLNWSRIGVRAILVPLLGTATIGFLQRGLRRERPAAFVLSGISLGLSMYTYQAARLLPVLVLGGFALAAWRRGGAAGQHCRGLLTVVAVSLLVFAPLGVHFLTHPGSFSRRIEEALVVQPEQGTPEGLRAIGGQLKETLLAFSFVGDETPYSTIPGRPSLNPFFSALLFLGIGFSLLEIRKPSRALLLAWLGLMIVPAALAGKGPTAKRAIGTLPAVAMLSAVGALSPWAYLERWWTRRSPEQGRWARAAWTAALLAGFVYSGAVTYRDYFVTWASNPNLPIHFEARVSAIGKTIGSLPPEEQVYLSPELPRHPAIRFHSGLREDVRGYNGRICFVAPRQTTADTTYVIVPGTGDASLGRLETSFPGGRRMHHGSGGAGSGFITYHVPGGVEARLEPPSPLEARWRDAIQFLGYELDGAAYGPGDTISLTLFYLDRAEMGKRYTVFVHLLGPINPATGNPLWGQSDSEPCRGFYPTSSWHEGEILMDRVELTVRDDAPPGTYRLSTGFYDVWTGERLPVSSASAPVESDALLLSEIEVRGGG